MTISLPNLVNKQLRFCFFYSFLEMVICLNNLVLTDRWDKNIAHFFFGKGFHRSFNKITNKIDHNFYWKVTFWWTWFYSFSHKCWCKIMAFANINICIPWSFMLYFFAQNPRAISHPKLTFNSLSVGWIIMKYTGRLLGLIFS